jgi:hypothetical protein
VRRKTVIAHEIVHETRLGREDKEDEKGDLNDKRRKNISL